MTPDAYTNQELFVEVGDGHNLYVHDWGNQGAPTVIFFLHGGPGDGSSDKYKNMFDPVRQRVIFHDQRGSGRSTPYGSLKCNTTPSLIEDISRIADKLDIPSFILTGGSWGSTLAFMYGIAHPERVLGIVVDGVFTARKSEIDWIDKGQLRSFFPDVWDKLLSATPESEHGDPASYHMRRALGDDPVAAKQSAYDYALYEIGALQLDDRPVPSNLEDFDPAGMVIEMAYLSQQCFIEEGYIMHHARTLNMPVYLVQGRYDMVCPPITAYELHKQLPNGQLLFTTSGHRGEHETWNLKRTLLLELSK